MKLSILTITAALVLVPVVSLPGCAADIPQASKRSQPQPNGRPAKTDAMNKGNKPLDNGLPKDRVEGAPLPSPVPNRGSGRRS